MKCGCYESDSSKQHNKIQLMHVKKHTKINEKIMIKYKT